MKNITVSQNSSFWNKLGKWPVLMIGLILPIFLIALQFTGRDKCMAALIAGLALSIIVLISVINKTYTCALAIYSFVIAMFAIFTIVATLTIPDLIIFTILIPTIITAFAANEAKKRDIRQWITWLSFLVEFLLIFLLMWIAH